MFLLKVTKTAISRGLTKKVGKVVFLSDSTIGSCSGIREVYAGKKIRLFEIEGSEVLTSK